MAVADAGRRFALSEANTMATDKGWGQPMRHPSKPAPAFSLRRKSSIAAGNSQP